MFLHNLKYALKTLFKNKILLFWTYAFPLLLGTFFYMAFSNIENSEKLKIMDIAIIKNEQFMENEIYQKTFEQLGKEGKDQLFNIQYTEEEKAKDLLLKDAIIGYIVFENEPKVVIKSSGEYETILKYVVDEIIQSEKMFQDIVEKEITKNPPIVENQEYYENIYQEITKRLEENITINDLSSKNLSYTMIEFYTLLAMTALYGGILGMVSINQNLANMSHKGKRVSISPTPKKTLIFTSALASYITQIIGMAILFLYTIFVLHVDYGTHFPLVLLLLLVGCLAGLSFGICLATVFKTSENVKTGIVISVTMFCCFLSGMMGITMKYIVDKNIPLLNKINPANMITDGLYSLYYYDTFDRFYLNISSLLIFSFIMILISIIFLRRQKYDSI